MKTINFKQIIILALSIFVFGACSDREVEVTDQEIILPPCGYNFTSATLNNGTSNIDVLDYDIDFAVNLNDSCATSYEMKYELMDLDTAVLVYIHEGNAISPDTFFTITSENFTNHIKVTGYDANFSLKFTIRNTGSQDTPQTKTIALNFEEFSITAPNDIEVYAKQTANYTSTLSNGGPGTTYTVKVEKNNGDNMGAGTSLMINSTSVALDTETTIDISSGELNFSFTPNNSRGGIFISGVDSETPRSANYKLTVTKNGVTKDEDFELSSKRPAFSTSLSLDNTTISTGSTTSLRVNLTLLDGYDQDLTYDYTIVGGITIDGNNGALNVNNITSDSTTHKPTEQVYSIGDLSGVTGTHLITVRVTNQHGFRVLNTINITIE